MVLKLCFKADATPFLENMNQADIFVNLCIDRAIPFMPLLQSLKTKRHSFEGELDECINAST